MYLDMLKGQSSLYVEKKQINIAASSEYSTKKCLQVCINKKYVGKYHSEQVYSGDYKSTYKYTNTYIYRLIWIWVRLVIIPLKFVMRFRGANFVSI